MATAEPVAIDKVWQATTYFLAAPLAGQGRLMQNLLVPAN
jgi:hypothetical protein